MLSLYFDYLNFKLFPVLILMAGFVVWFLVFTYFLLPCG